EKEWVFASELIFPFPGELKASPGIPSYLDDWDVTLFKLFDLSVYNLYWFLDEMEFIINLNFF
ncbi:hypothetical protein Tco_0186694, partial [Tanacetum coccineum]